jgi:DNA-binding NarL/FixJ family response regulator
MPHTVLIADDHPLFREALKLAVAQALPGLKVREADCVAALLAALEAEDDIELLLLDLNMPGAQGFSALVQSRSHYPAVPVIVISGREDPHIVSRTLAHGAAGFVPKSAPIATIVEALRAVAQGGIWTPEPQASGAPLDANADLAQGESDAARRIASLTPQQFRVLSMLCSGLINKQIAAELGVSEATVKAHMTAIMEKLGASNRTQAVLIAQQLALDHAAGSSALD